VVPKLDGKLQKGSSGHLLVLGGSESYTGAPFFAAMSALYCGIDLVTVVCTPEASIPIKSYSPDLMVTPILLHPDKVAESFFSRVETIVVGPGLGRDPRILDSVSQILNLAKESGISVVIDGDGLFLIAQQPKLVMNWTNCILTPNPMEFRRLWQAVEPNIPAPDFDTGLIPLGNHSSDYYAPDCDQATKDTTYLAQRLGVTIVRKGSVDIGGNGMTAYQCHDYGSPRRCGGQGDILAGCIGVFLLWSMRSDAIPVHEKTLVSIAAGCTLTRLASRLAFDKSKRGTVTSEIVKKIPKAFEINFPCSL